MQCHKYFLHSFYQNIWLLIKMAFFLPQKVYISKRQVVRSYLQIKQQKREVEMVPLLIVAFMKSQVSPLSLILSYMFASYMFEVLVLLKS